MAGLLIKDGICLQDGDLVLTIFTMAHSHF